MWRDNPFSHRNMTTEKTVEAGVGGDREVGVRGCVDKIWKRGVGVGNIVGGLHKMAGLDPSVNYVKRL